MTFDRKIKCIRYTDIAYDLRESRSDAFSEQLGARVLDFSMPSSIRTEQWY